MRLNTSKTIQMAMTLGTWSLGLVGCNDAGFRGGDKQAAAVAQNPNLRPPTDDIKKPGWMTPQAQEQWRKIFDQAGTGSDPNSPTNPGTPGSPSDPLLSGVDGVLWIPCGTDTKKVNEFSADFSGKKGSRVRLSGEFCPTASASEITVLFVIDHSGSMEHPDEGGPNDPTSGSGCRRLEASKVLVEKYAALTSTNVRVGVVNFASRARIEVPIGGIDEMRSRLDASTFCGMKKELDNLTNYEDAFSYARKALADVEGPKVVYFITDGMPTTYGNGAQSVPLSPVPGSAGLRAAKELREMDGVSLNALFVGYRGKGVKDPRGYLEEITGNKDAVRVTKDADELVKAAAAINIDPVKIALDDTAVKIQNPAGSSDLGMARVTANPTKVGAHVWVTEPFVLVGTTDQVVKNILTATAKTSTGDSLKTVATINFKQLD